MAEAMGGLHEPNEFFYTLLTGAKVKFLCENHLRDEDAVEANGELGALLDYFEEHENNWLPLPERVAEEMEIVSFCYADATEKSQEMLLYLQARTLSNNGSICIG